MDKNPAQNDSKSEARRAAEDIARQLDETNPEALDQIELIIQQVGVEKAQEFLRETLETEAGGGLMVRDGTRRRTPGGVYFYLARGKLSRQDRRSVWPPKPKPPPPPPFEWKKRLEIVPKLLKKLGEAKTVKITLIGRPGRVVEKAHVVLTSMQLKSNKAPSLPKGLPPIPDELTTYIVYIARKQ